MLYKCRDKTKQTNKEQNRTTTTPPPKKKPGLELCFKASPVREKSSKKGPKPVQRTDLRITKSLKESILVSFPIPISSVGDTGM